MLSQTIPQIGVMSSVDDMRVVQNRCHIIGYCYTQNQPISSLIKMTPCYDAQITLADFLCYENQFYLYNTCFETFNYVPLQLKVNSNDFTNFLSRS